MITNNSYTKLESYNKVQNLEGDWPTHLQGKNPGTLDGLGPEQKTQNKSIHNLQFVVPIKI